MRKRVFINMHYLEIGGAESALIGMLQSMNPEEAEVDLFLNDPRGEMMRFVPEWVKVVESPSAYRMIEAPLSRALWKGHIGVALGRLMAKIRFALYRRRMHPKDGNGIFGYVGRCVTPFLPSLKKLGHYDVAISYLAPHDVVARKVDAEKKVCWIHTDYSSVDVNARLEFPVWDAYDRIVGVSDDVSRAFVSVFPELADKVVTKENEISPEFLHARAEEFEAQEMKREDGKTILLTVGRYSYPKNLESIPLLCRLLKEQGVDVHWYIIGYGADDSYIREAIASEGMEGRVTLLGKKENPYPYFKACDLYVQPSRYEGKAVTVKEALLLGKPVAITDYPTARSQVRDGVDGFIGRLDPREFAEDLAAIIVKLFKTSDTAPK